MRCVHCRCLRLSVFHYPLFILPHEDGDGLAVTAWVVYLYSHEHPRHCSPSHPFGRTHTPAGLHFDILSRSICAAGTDVPARNWCDWLRDCSFPPASFAYVRRLLPFNAGEPFGTNSIDSIERFAFRNPLFPHVCMVWWGGMGKRSRRGLDGILSSIIPAHGSSWVLQLLSVDWLGFLSRFYWSM